MGQALHLHGRVIIDDHTEVDDVWVVDGKLTFERPQVPTQRIDGWVLPGLVDMHCHVGLDSGGAVDDELATKQAHTDRDAGTLLIRDAGSPRDTHFLDDQPDAPRIIRAGRFIARPKRYFLGYAQEIEAEQLPREMERQARAGDGWVKLIADWIDRPVGDLTPLWNGEVLKAGVASAHALGARVTAHTFSHEAIPDLLAAGIDCIEHGTGMTEADMQAAAQRGVPVVPTLLQVANFAGYAEQGRAKFPVYAQRMIGMFERRYEHVRNLYEAGVQLFLGTDAGGTLGHGMLADEAHELVRAGVPNHEVVAAASYKAREFLGASGITEGAAADIVVYAADPRQDIAALKNPHAVILRGENHRR